MSEHGSAMADLVAGVLSGDYFDVEHPINEHWIAYLRSGKAGCSNIPPR
jgi:hypothetical protein